MRHLLLPAAVVLFWLTHCVSELVIHTRELWARSSGWRAGNHTFVTFEVREPPWWVGYGLPLVPFGLACGCLLAWVALLIEAHGGKAEQWPIGHRRRRRDEK